jgi:hypothetical protein
MLSLDEFLDRIAARCIEEGLRYDFDISIRPEYQAGRTRCIYECRLSINIFDIDDNKNSITYRAEFIIPTDSYEGQICFIAKWIKDVFGWDIDVGGDG